MKYHRYTFLIVSLAVVASGVSIATAQDLVLARLPSNEVNSPGSDLFFLERPALSLAGFENPDPGRGLGLREILEMRFVAHDPLIVPVFDRLIALAAEDQADPFEFEPDDRWHRLDRNTAILQSRAFETLVTFVLTLNGYHSAALQQWGLRPHADAAAALRQAFTAPAGGVLIRGDGIIFDPMRHARSLCNLARAIDLYLALENAYAQFPLEADETLLLSPAERGEVMQETATALLTTDGLLSLRAIDVYAPEIDLPPEVKAQLLAIIEALPVASRTLEEVQAGNWSMKLRLAAGYGALAVQLQPELPEAAVLKGLLEKALRSAAAAGEAVADRNRQWNFMTYGGKRFWAEAPYYFDFVLEQALPFWHAVRLNGLFDQEDVFHQAWFTHPLHWHADLVTPDGTMVPIDDGNRTPMRSTGLLRWTGAYGDPDLGRKFAWIDEQLGGPGRRDETLLVELAIPRTRTGQEPAQRVGSSEKELVPHATEQQLILRNALPGGETDFVFLNGEHGMAVERGEGHEQPDQLQLLYYRDDVSYLADSGYDRGYTVANSFWNHYYDHNVLTAGGGEGGLQPPSLNLFEIRKTSEPAETGEVASLYIQEHGSLTLMHGEQPLNVESGPGYRGVYQRDVLYVPGLMPYLVDLNGIRYETPPVDCVANQFQLLYHVNSDVAHFEADDRFVQWSNISGDATRSLRMYPVSMDFDLGSFSDSNGHVALIPDTILEQEGPSGMVSREILRLTVSTNDQCRPQWRVSTVIQPRFANADDGHHPIRLWSHDSQTESQGWVWEKADDVLDMFVARSADSPQTDLTIGIGRAHSALPPLDFVLPAASSFGFARVVRGESGWAIDPAFALGLELIGEGVATASESGGTDLPASYALHANYPNPFNPATEIMFDLRDTGPVRLAVYDLLGREVARLVDGMLEAGTHRVTWDAVDHASGVYLYRLTAGSFTSVRAMTLVQ